MAEDRLRRDREQRAKEEGTRAERAKRCAEARRASARFEVGYRQYRLAEQGNRVYYSSEEINQHSAAAARAMQEFCAPTK